MQSKTKILNWLFGKFVFSLKKTAKTTEILKTNKTFNVAMD
jgi:hypothetical protein